MLSLQLVVVLALLLGVSAFLPCAPLSQRSWRLQPQRREVLQLPNNARGWTVSARRKTTARRKTVGANSEFEKLWAQTVAAPAVEVAPIVVPLSQLNGGLYTVLGVGDGVEPLRLLVDSGAARTTVSATAVERAGGELHGAAARCMEGQQVGPPV